VPKFVMGDMMSPANAEHVYLFGSTLATT